MYTYNAKIIAVYDGDTVTAEIDLGFKIKLVEKFRLFGINAPEMRGSEKVAGKESRDWLRERILDKNVIITTKKDKKGKYGRYIGTIYLSFEDGNGISINRELVEAGHAVFKDY